jgi:sulfur-carrier protein
MPCGIATPGCHGFVVWLFDAKVAWDSQERLSHKNRGTDRMAVKVMIPTPLRQFTGKQSSLECNAATVGEALGSLTGTYTELKKHLFTDEGKIRSFVNVYLNDEDIRFLDKENTRTKDGDTISIVPSIAGGCAGRGKTDSNAAGRIQRRT